MPKPPEKKYFTPFSRAAARKQAEDVSKAAKPAYKTKPRSEDARKQTNDVGQAAKPPVRTGSTFKTRSIRSDGTIAPKPAYKSKPRPEDSRKRTDDVGQAAKPPVRAGSTFKTRSIRSDGTIVPKPAFKSKPRSADAPKEKPAIPGQCPLYKRCGGCQLQNMDYPRQLAWKQARVVELLGQYGHVEPIIGMKDPYHYRNKVQAAFGLDRNRRIISGVYQSTTRRIVPVKSCMIEDRKADKIVCTIRRLLIDNKMLPYDEDSHRGFLRHVLIRRGFASGQIMVVLVVGTPIFPAKKRFVAALLEAHPDITTILLNINDRLAGLMLGDDERVLYGDGAIEDTLCGCVFRISAKSFYQINPTQTTKLYNHAIELAALTGNERVIDAYCGIGTIGLIASRHAAQVLGIESNRDAVRDATANARRNDIKNITFQHADAGELMKQIADDGESVDVVFLDPPRAGSDPQFLSSLAALAPKRIVYISCNPETLARDLRLLLPHGYAVKSVQPVDMFPHTNHVEVVTVLTRSGFKAKK